MTVINNTKKMVENFINWEHNHTANPNTTLFINGILDSLGAPKISVILFKKKYFLSGNTVSQMHIWKQHYSKRY